MKQILQNWSDPFFWLSCNLAGIVVPVVIGMIVSAAIKLGFSLGAITNGGQFALYSLAMLATTLYILAKASPKRLPFTRGFALAFFLLVAFSIAFFVLCVLYQNGANIAGWIIEWPTIAIFIICVIVTFFAVVSDKRREIESEDLERIKDSRRASLEQAFDQMQNEVQSDE